MNVTSTSTTASLTWTEGGLFTWHGTELLVIPFMTFTGILGNLVVFYIYHFRWRSDTVTLVKRMLAGLDLVNLILAMPIVLHLTIYPLTPTFVPLCRVSSFVALTSAFISAMVLLIIAVDRYLKLCKLKKRGITAVMSKKLFLASSLLSIIINIPTFWLFGRDNIHFHYYHIRTSYCFIDENKDDNLFAVWSALLGLVFLINTNVLVFLYTKIIKTLRDLSKKHDELKRRPSISAGDGFLKKEKQSKVMRMTAIVFIIITIVYFLSYAPYFASLVLSMADPTVEGGMGPKMKALYDLCKLSPLLNNVANPFIYSFTSQRFRTELRKLVTLKSCKAGFLKRKGQYTVSNSSNNKSIEQEVSQISETN